MDPSLVIKGVDENIKIFCSLVVLFFSLSLSVENGWQKESTDSQGSSKLQNHFDIWISGSTCHTMTFHDIPMDNLGCQ